MKNASRLCDALGFGCDQDLGVKVGERSYDFNYCVMHIPPGGDPILDATHFFVTDRHPKPDLNKAAGKSYADVV